MKFSQQLCSLDHGSDVMVRAFVSHLLELGLIPLSTHDNNIKNSVCLFSTWHSAIELFGRMKSKPCEIY